jgi:hypothetical protein
MQYQSAQEQKGASKRQAEESRVQAGLEQKRADIQNTRQLRTALRQSRISRANVENAGANAGTSNSSGVLGGVASIGTQSAANVGFFGQMGELSSQITASNQRQGNAAADYGQAAGDAAIWGAFGSLGNSVFQGAGGYKTIFSS